MDMVRNITCSKNGTSIFARLAVSAILLLSLCRVANTQEAKPKSFELTFPTGTVTIEIIDPKVTLNLDEKGFHIVLQGERDVDPVVIQPEQFPTKPGEISDWTTISKNDRQLVRYRLKRGTLTKVLGLARTFDKGGSVYDLDISTDGQRVLLAGDIPNSYIMLWEPQTGKALKRFDTELPPTNVAITPDGKIGAFGSLSDMAQILDLETGEVLHRLPHQTFILGIAFSPDGKLLATGGVDHAICIWNVENGEELLRIREHTDWVTRVVFLPNGQLVSSSADQTVRIWDPKEGTEIRKIEHPEPVWALNVSADGKYLITGLGGRSIDNPSVPWVTPAKENTAFVWETETGKQVQKLTGHTGAIMGASITPDGKHAVTSAFDKTLRLWDVATGKELQKLDYESMQWTVQFARDGQSLVTVGGAYRAPDEDVTTVSPQERVHLYGLGVALKDVKQAERRFAPVKSKSLTLKPLKSLKKESIAYSAAFMPDGKRILAGGDTANQAVDLWEIETDRKLLSLDAGDACNFIAVSPDGGLAATAGVSDGRIAILDLSKGVIRHQIQHGDPVTRVRFTHDGKRLIASGTDGALSIWDAQTFQLIKTIAAHDGPIFSFALSPDNTKVISGGADGRANCWDIESGEMSFSCRHDSPVWSLEVSPDGKMFATGTGGQVVGAAENLQVEASDDNVIRLWSTADGRRSSEMRGHQQAVCALAFTPDGKYLISGSYDRSVRVWNLETRRQSGSARITSQGWITSLAVSPDGRQLLVTGGAHKSRGQTVEFVDERLRLFEINEIEVVAMQQEQLKLNAARVVRMPANVQAPVRVAEPKSKTDLKRIGLAFHNYHDVHRRFPPARIIGEDGKTPHSWRVAILPYLGEEFKALHDSYRFDEPWDSENNKQLIEKIPSVYQSETDPKSANAAYFVPTGPETMFPIGDEAEGTRIRDIRDGTTNTIMAVQAKRDIPWTKPDDLPCEDLEKLPEFGGILKDGYWTLFADGSVRMLPNDLATETRRILVTKAGGEVVPNLPEAGRVTREVAEPLRRAAVARSHRNNLKQIGLAMHNYHDMHRVFPQANIPGPDGRTPHSWRVALLPLLGHQELYDSYHFDEPWDSEHNKTLLDKMPAVYRSPNAKPDSTNSGYFLPIGEETLFPPEAEQGTRIREVLDGTTNTIMVLEAQREIPWTKPEDIPVALDEEAPKLGEEGEKRFHAAFADGSVQLLDVDIEAGLLWSFLTKAGGETVRLPQ